MLDGVVLDVCRYALLHPWKLAIKVCPTALITQQSITSNI